MQQVWDVKFPWTLLIEFPALQNYSHQRYYTPIVLLHLCIIINYNSNIYKIGMYNTPLLQCLINYLPTAKTWPICNGKAFLQSIPWCLHCPSQGCLPLHSSSTSVQESPEEDQCESLHHCFYMHWWRLREKCVSTPNTYKHIHEFDCY